MERKSDEIVVFAFGVRVPDELVKMVTEEDGIENCNTDFFETLLWYDYVDAL